jgi:hypothetical protein
MCKELTFLPSMAGTVWSFHFFFFLEPMGDDQEVPEKV